MIAAQQYNKMKGTASPTAEEQEKGALLQIEEKKGRGGGRKRGSKVERKGPKVRVVELKKRVVEREEESSSDYGYHTSQLHDS